LSQRAEVKLEVFNIIGQRVATLLAENREAGNHEVLWQPASLSSGVYFYRLHAKPASGKIITLTRKLLFIK
jgi:hypothetical protein